MTVNRVRALIITPNNKFLLIKRLEPGKDIYYIFPGGHMEDIDNNDIRQTLIRELKEEINAKGIDIKYPFYLDTIENQYIFLVNVDSWSQEGRTGLEYLDKARGEDIIEEIDIDYDTISNLDLLPHVRDYILKYIDDIYSMPKVDCK